MRTLKQHWVRLTGLMGLAGLTLAGLYAAVSARGQNAALSIKPLGSNQYSILVTNGQSSSNYSLYWTPALNDSVYPWQLLSLGNIGQTNFTIDGGTWPYAFFRVAVGTDWDGDGVANWADANPYDPTIGILTITIDSPTNGAVIY